MFSERTKYKREHDECFLSKVFFNDKSHMLLK